MNLRAIFFFAVFAVAFWILHAFILPIAMGAVLAVASEPIVTYLIRRKWKRTRAAIFVTIGITLLVLLPMTGIIFLGAKAIIEQIQAFQGDAGASGISASGIAAWLHGPWLDKLIQWGTEYLPVQKEELIAGLRDLLWGSVGKSGEVLAAIAAQVPGTAVALVLVILGLLFALIDGPDLVKFLREHSPIPKPELQRMMSVGQALCRSVVLASLLSGGTQALLEGVACLIAGVPNIFMIIVLVFIGSFIPLVGSSPVTIAVAIWQFLEGHMGAGIVLSVSAIVVMFADNVIRPAFYAQGKAGLHPLVAFLATLGGIQALGVFGIFLGPILVALGIEALRISPYAEK